MGLSLFETLGLGEGTSFVEKVEIWKGLTRSLFGFFGKIINGAFYKNNAVFANFFLKFLPNFFIAS